MHTKLSIPERLKDLRVVDKHLTLEQLAEQTGLSKSALSKYESDDYKDISPFAIATLAEFYGVSTDYLMGLSENKNHPNTELQALHLSDDRLVLVGLLRSRFGKQLNFQIGQHHQFEMEEIEDINWPRTSPFVENGHLDEPEGIIDELTVEHWFIQNNVEHHPNANDIFTVKSTQKFITIPEGDSGGKSFKRLHRWRYSPTAAYGNNEVHLHPYLARRISVAEALAIQSLPEDFSLPPDLPLSAKFKMVGNGVPYLLALGIANDISEWIDQFLHRIEE